MLYHRVLSWGHFYSNIFINDLPLHITDSKVVCDLFADNSIHSSGTDVESVQYCLQEGLNDVSKWRYPNRSVIHSERQKPGNSRETKTHQLKPLMLHFTLGTNIADLFREHRVLGVILHEELKWQRHIENLCKQMA